MNTTRSWTDVEKKQSMRHMVKKLNTSEVAVLHCIDNHADKHGVSRLKVSTIGSYTGIGERQVQRIKKSLAEKKVIEIKTSPGRSDSFVVRYVTPDTDDTPDISVTPTPVRNVTPPPTPMSPRSKTVKEDKSKKREPKPKRKIVVKKKQERKNFSQLTGEFSLDRAVRRVTEKYPDLEIGDVRQELIDLQVTSSELLDKYLDLLGERNEEE